MRHDMISSLSKRDIKGQLLYLSSLNRTTAQSKSQGVKAIHVLALRSVSCYKTDMISLLIESPCANWPREMSQLDVQVMTILLVRYNLLSFQDFSLFRAGFENMECLFLRSIRPGFFIQDSVHCFWDEDSVNIPSSLTSLHRWHICLPS